MDNEQDKVYSILEVINIKAINKVSREVQEFTFLLGNEEEVALRR